MTTLELPDPPARDLDLALKEEELLVRGTSLAPEARERLRRRISVGGPVHRRITAVTTDDAELRRFLEQEAADSDFYLLLLTCTLRPEPDEPFTEVLLALELSGPDGGATPIAWSMSPDRLVDAVEVSTTVNLGPNLKIFGVGLELGAERQRTLSRRDVYLEAMYELESTPSWGLYRTDAVPLRGLHRFHLVVRAPKASVVTGTTQVEAKVQRQRFGVFPYRVAVDDGPVPLDFRLGGDG